MASPQSRRRWRHLSVRDRDWIAGLTFGFLFVIGGAVLVGWTIPRAIGEGSSPTAAAIFVVWVIVAGSSCLLIGRGARRGEDMADRALADRRTDWEWPDR
jgi:hypothetical protein